MKALLLLTLVAAAIAAVASAAAGPRARRSYLAGGGGGLYALGGGLGGGVYAASAPVVSSYTTARELPSYVVPESTHVTTATNTVYNVQVPVTYSTTYAQPSVRTTSYYHPVAYAPVATYRAPVATYSVPVATYHAPAWGVGGVARTGYADPWW